MRHSYVFLTNSQEPCYVIDCVAKKQESTDLGCYNAILARPLNKEANCESAESAEICEKDMEAQLTYPSDTSGKRCGKYFQLIN